MARTKPHTPAPPGHPVHHLNVAQRRTMYRAGMLRTARPAIFRKAGRNVIPIVETHNQPQPNRR